jgi:hypothetical protein
MGSRVRGRIEGIAVGHQATSEVRGVIIGRLAALGPVSRMGFRCQRGG